MTVIFNNKKYAAMQGMHQKMYPDGIAAEIDLYHGTHINAPDFVKVAESVGGYGETGDGSGEAPGCAEARPRSQPQRQAGDHRRDRYIDDDDGDGRLFRRSNRASLSPKPNSTTPFSPSSQRQATVRGLLVRYYRHCLRSRGNWMSN